MKILRFLSVLVLLTLVVGSVGSTAYAQGNTPGGPNLVDNTKVTPDPVVAGDTVYIDSELTYNTSGTITVRLCVPQDWSAPLTSISPTGVLDTWGVGSSAGTTTISGVTVDCADYSNTSGSPSGWDSVEWSFTVSASATAGSDRPVRVWMYAGNSGNPPLQTVYVTVQSPPTTRYVGNATADCGGNTPCDTGTSGLQDAINALPSTGGTIIIGGQYNSGGANVGSKDITLQPLDSNAELRAASSCSGGAPIVLNSSGDLTIDGLTLNGTGAPAGCSDGVDVSGASSGNLSVQNSSGSIKNWGGHGISIASGASGSYTFSNSTFSNNSYGIVASSSSATVSVSGCTFSSNTSDGIYISNGTATVENSTFSGNTRYGINQVGGTLTVRGNTFQNNTNYGLYIGGGTAVAYANEFNGNKGGGYQAYVQDLDDAAKNWWGSHSNSAVGPTTDGSTSYSNGWNARLGADVESWAAGDGSASLGNASLSGGSGTAVIISMGSDSANAPFGNGVPPYVNQACSPFYDFYAVNGGASGNWTVQLPIDNTTDCTNNVLNKEIAFEITPGSYDSDCTTANNPACWDKIDDSKISVSGNNLLISMAGSDLAGTHIVAGDSSGGYDPTIVTLKDVSASSDSHLWVSLALLAGVVVLAGGFAVARRREWL